MLAGPDVSNAQGPISWPGVRLSGDALAFAIAKCSEGTSFVDVDFAHNWRSIREKGLIRGAYHYADFGVSRAASMREAREAATREAQHALAVLHEVGGIGAGDLPPMLDLEVKTGPAGAVLYDWIDTWVHVVKSATGRTPMLYTSASWWEEMGLRGFTNVWGCPLWVADWGARAPALPSPWRSWTLWQFTNNGRVEGFANGIDVSYFHGSRSELECLAGRSPRAHGEPARHDPRAPASTHHGADGHAGEVPPWPGRILKPGEHGEDVRRWQERMLGRGFVHMRTDGIFDAACSDSCRWLQLYLRYPPTGHVDEADWKATWLAP